MNESEMIELRKENTEMKEKVERMVNWIIKVRLNN